MFLLNFSILINDEHFKALNLKNIEYDYKAVDIVKKNEQVWKNYFLNEKIIFSVNIV
jgi:hypothetical protein